MNEVTYDVLYYSPIVILVCVPIIVALAAGWKYGLLTLLASVTLLLLFLSIMS